MRLYNNIFNAGNNLIIEPRECINKNQTVLYKLYNFTRYCNIHVIKQTYVL